jgi:hypothetical protein
MSRVWKVIEDAYAARAAGDPGEIARIFGPGGSLQLAGSPDHSPVVVRAANVHDAAATLIANFIFVRQDLMKKIVDGDHAAARWSVTLRHAGTGRQADTELYDHWHAPEGGPVSLVQFADTALLNYLAGV